MAQLKDTVINGKLTLGTINDVEETINHITNFYDNSQEIIIGKWIDGRNIYRKYIPFGQIHGTAPTKPHGIVNLDRPIHLYGTARDTTSSGRFTITLPFISTSSLDKQINLGINDTDVVIYNNGQNSKYSAFVFIEYIKTSD